MLALCYQPSPGTSNAFCSIRCFACSIQAERRGECKGKHTVEEMLKGFHSMQALGLRILSVPICLLFIGRSKQFVVLLMETEMLQEKKNISCVCMCVYLMQNKQTTKNKLDG